MSFERCVGLLLGFYGSDSVVDFGSRIAGFDDSFKELLGYVQVFVDSVNVPGKKGEVENS